MARTKSMRIRYVLRNGRQARRQLQAFIARHAKIPAIHAADDARDVRQRPRARKPISSAHSAAARYSRQICRDHHSVDAGHHIFRDDIFDTSLHAYAIFLISCRGVGRLMRAITTPLKYQRASTPIYENNTRRDDARMGRLILDHQCVLIAAMIRM